MVELKAAFIAYIKQEDAFLNKRKQFKEALLNSYQSETEFDEALETHIHYYIEAKVGIERLNNYILMRSMVKRGNRTDEEKIKTKNKMTIEEMQ